MAELRWPARWSARRIAGLAYLVPIATVAGTWYTFLVVAAAPRSDYAALLREWLVDDPDRAVFWWLVALPLICAGLAAAYLAPKSHGKAASAAWCAAGIALALGASRSLDASIAMAVALPLAFSIPGTLWQLARPHPAQA